MFAEFIKLYGMEILVAILGFIGTVLGFVFKNIVKNILNDQTKWEIARICVQFVEQVYKDLHGADKFYAALDRAAKLLQEKGIEFSATEMETLIEAAVAEFNEAFYRKSCASEKLLE